MTFIVDFLVPNLNKVFLATVIGDSGLRYNGAAKRRPTALLVREISG